MGGGQRRQTGYKRCLAPARPQVNPGRSRCFVNMSKASLRVLWALKVSVLFSRCRSGHGRCRDPPQVLAEGDSFHRGSSGHDHEERSLSWKRLPAAWPDHPGGSWMSDLMLSAYISTGAFGEPCSSSTCLAEEHSGEKNTAFRYSWSHIPELKQREAAAPFRLPQLVLDERKPKQLKFSLKTE